MEKSFTANMPMQGLKNVDISKAEKLPGVRAVLSGYNIPDVRVGFLKDQTVLKKGIVRQFRDEVAAVAAISEEIAEEALGLIEVEYEELPAVFDPIEAMKEGGCRLHYEAFFSRTSGIDC